MMSHRLRSVWRRGTTPALLVLIIGCSALRAAESPAPASAPRGISVSAEGEVSGRPDVAILQLGVSTRAGSVREAQARAQAAMDRLLSAVKGRGVAERDIQTRHFSISPEYAPPKPGSDQPPRVTGYQVHNSVSVKIRKIENTGEVIDTAAQAAGDAVAVHGISFTVDDFTALRNQAREKAMLAAGNKAAQLARLANVRLGPPLYIAEGVSGGMPPPLPMGSIGVAAAFGERTPISPGELEVTVTVQVTYAIVP